MKLTEKIDRLEAQLARFKKIAQAFPDVEIKTDNSGVNVYYCSKLVMQNSQSLEFLVGDTLLDHHHEICVYSDVDIGTGIICGRVYGDPMNIKVLSCINRIMYCHNYDQVLKNEGAQETTIRKVHAYVANWIKDNPNIQIDKDRLPQNIKNVLVFI
jgi:hypothetical protein